MKVAIIYNSFLDETGQEQTIGGVHTYLWYLSDLIAELGGSPVIFQCSKIPFETQIGPRVVVGVVPSRGMWSDFRRDLFRAAVSRIEYGKEILIFGADHDSVRAWNSKCISIQHGLSWDAPARFFLKRIPLSVPFPMKWRKRWAAFRAKQYFENCPNRVCVDYNFLNWYRTKIADAPIGRVWTIPNFVDVPAGFEAELPRPWEAPVKLICARRFLELRGSRLMEEVVARLLSRYADIRMTFAGDGPDINRLMKCFENDSRVQFSKFRPHESVLIHSQYDISLIPSLASEGTTFSAIEAMAAGCAVVATNVGGLTNIIIDGYNGRLVHPEVEQLTAAVSSLILDSSLRVNLGLRARDTAQVAFSLKRWKEAWKEVLTTVERD